MKVEGKKERNLITVGEGKWVASLVRHRAHYCWLVLTAIAFVLASKEVIHAFQAYSKAMLEASGGEENPEVRIKWKKVKS